MPRSPITESLNRVNEAIAYLNNALNPGEIDLLLDQLAPLPEPEPVKKSQKKSSKKSAGKGGGKSKHASSLQQQISGTGSSLIQPPAAATTDDTDDSTHTRCHFTRSDGKLCFLLPDHNIHHMKTANEYHEFQPAEQAAATSGD